MRQGLTPSTLWVIRGGQAIPLDELEAETSPLVHARSRDSRVGSRRPGSGGAQIVNCTAINCGGAGLHVGPGALANIDGFQAIGCGTGIVNEGEIRGRRILVK